MSAAAQTPMPAAAQPGTQLGKTHDLMREALRNFGDRAPSRAMAACIAEHAVVLGSLDTFYESLLRTQVRFESASARYESQAEDERDRLLEAAHKRTLAQLRREKEEIKGRRELLEVLGGQTSAHDDKTADAEHKQKLAALRRQKEDLVAQREVVSAEQGLEAEKTFKGVKFELGQRRYESKIAEVEVGVAVAKNASGQDAKPSAGNESSEVGMIFGLIERKQREIEEAEADGRDSTDKRLQFAKLKELLSLM
jgi:hypothetical protein